MAARFAIETGHWGVVTQIPATVQLAEVVFARGLAALEQGQVAVANNSASVLQNINTADVEARRLVHAATDDLLRTILLSRIAFSENRPADAQRLGLAAVEMEKQTDVATELNGIVKPATEFYGETLLGLKKPREAADQFAEALRQHPKRALSLLGLARARAMAGDAAGAKNAYADLASIWSEADTSLPAVTEMRNFLK
jgi:predicted Zn-dependent protease